MTTRLLPPDEWPKLVGTLLDPMWQTFNPRFTEVIVVERDGMIVASVALLMALHAECLSIHGGAGVARALWSALGERVQAAGGRAVWAAAVDEPMRGLLERHAEPIPGDHFLMRV